MITIIFALFSGLLTLDLAASAFLRLLFGFSHACFFVFVITISIIFASLLQHLSISFIQIVGIIKVRVIDLLLVS